MFQIELRVRKKVKKNKNQETDGYGTGKRHVTEKKLKRKELTITGN